MLLVHRIWTQKQFKNLKSWNSFLKNYNKTTQYIGLTHINYIKNKLLGTLLTGHTEFSKTWKKYTIEVPVKVGSSWFLMKECCTSLWRADLASKASPNKSTRFAVKAASPERLEMTLPERKSKGKGEGANGREDNGCGWGWGRTPPGTPRKLWLETEING